MNLTVDHYFAIGRRHVTAGEPCQDYALSGSLPHGQVFGVIADGCSGAHAHTDIGARVLAHAFAGLLAERGLSADAAGAPFAGRNEDPFDAGFTAALEQRFRSGWFTRRSADYLATVVGFQASARRAAVYMFGDGVVMLRYRDGRYRMLVADWHQNAPYYLAYALDPMEAAEFRRTLRPAQGDWVSVTDLTFLLTDEGVQLQSRDVYGRDFAAFEKGWTFEFDPEIEGVQALAVASDGVTDFSGSGLPGGEAGWMAVAASLMSFKNYQGAFVKRRAIRALEAYAGRSIMANDDLAMAAVWFDRGLPAVPGSLNGGPRP